MNDAARGTIGDFQRSVHLDRRSCTLSAWIRRRSGAPYDGIDL